MPGLTGLELSRRARELRPGLPVLLMTGYSELLSREALQRAGASRVIMKPFNRRELGNAVATALTGESDPGSAGPEGSEGLSGTQCYR